MEEILFSMVKEKQDILFRLVAAIPSKNILKILPTYKTFYF